MSTELQILYAGERLFAKQGIDATSLRQISTAAGQRNTAAAQYHFGDKRKLIEAVFRHRLGVIDARRHEMLESARKAGRTADPWELTEILVRPLAEQALRPGSHYVRFLRRVFEYTGLDVAALREIGGVDEAVAVGRLLGDRLPHLAGSLVHRRHRWAGQLIIAGLADLERRSAEPADGDGAPDTTDPEADILGLIDAVTGLLTAPVSERSAARRTAPDTPAAEAVR